MMARIVASAIAFVVLLACMVLPLLGLAVLSGSSLDAEAPSWSGWLVVVGGAVGAGAGFLAFRAVILRMGGFSSHEINRLWNGKSKNT
jgi:hypothetical protein